MFSFSHLWRQYELSDVDLSISSSTPDEANTLIPAHKAILSASPYFKAQVQRWMQQDDDACNVSGSRQDSSDHPSADAGQLAARRRPKLTLMLANQAGIAAADQIAAAEAVIAAMYSVSSLENLTDSQLLSMAITADMLQLDAAAKQAVECLHKRGELSSDVQQHFMDLPVWAPAILPLFGAMATSMPVSVVADAWVRNCVQPPKMWFWPGWHDGTINTADAPMRAELQELLLDQFGNLDAVWTQPDLFKELMSLPLLAMELLLSSDEIQVSSEDNVLCTAQAYADAQPIHLIAAADLRLARLIRVPSLSKLWQSAPVLAHGHYPTRLLLDSLVPQLKQYMALTWVGPCTQDEAKQVMTQPECASWFRGGRLYMPLTDGVELTWELSVSALKAASMRTCTSKRRVYFESDALTPPLQGVCWGLEVACVFDGAVQDAGSKLGVYSVPRNLPKGTYVTSSHHVTISSPVRRLKGVRDRLDTASGDTWGWRDFFDLGVMAGGWDETAWAAKGLPTHGMLQLKLKVKPSP